MVSYSSQDRERVMQFVRALRASGVAVWIDQGGIDGAQRWSEEIVNAIEACRTVLLFISRTSMESQNIAREVALAWESGKHFLPVALEDAKIPKSMQYQLAGIQYVKLCEGDPDAKFESVLRALVRLGVRVSPYSMAVVSAGVGEREQALEWLAKACDERSHGLSRLKSEPRFNAMRSDPQFQELAKRAESLALELEDATSEIILTQPIASSTRPSDTPAGPVPTWKRLLWPDIVDANSAREAAGQGVWAAILIIACRWILSFLVPTPMMTARSWWDDPIVWTILWGVIGFSVQKMGRPAAILGALLCVAGAWLNLDVLTMYRIGMEQQQVYRNMGQTLPGQPDYAGLYYGALFGVVAGIAFVIAFINASRGTLAYRQMVAQRQTTDKQDALSSQDFLLVRRKAMGAIQKFWGSKATAPATVNNEAPASAVAAPAPVAARMSKPAAISQNIAALKTAESERATAVGETRPVFAATEEAPLAVVASGNPIAVDQFPKFDDAPEIHNLADLIGSRPFRVMRALAFLAANLAAGLVMILARDVMLPGPMHPVYWQFAILRGIAITLASVAAFRFVRSGWLASVLATAVSLAFILTVDHFTLGTFTIGDVFYREQFQEFALIPFVDVLVTLLGLFYLIPRVRPLALGIFAGAVSAEIVSSMLITTLREFGAGVPPDPVLAGTLAFFVGVRSLVFAGVFWGALKFAGIGRASATSSYSA